MQGSAAHFCKKKCPRCRPRVSSFYAVKGGLKFLFARFAVFVRDNGLCQLIGAGGVVSALDPAQNAFHLVQGLAFHKFGNSLQVSAAAADKFYVVDLVFCVHVKDDLAGAGSFCVVSVHCFITSFGEKRIISTECAKRSVYKIFIDHCIYVRSFQFPFFINILCGFSVRHNKFEFQHGLGRGEDAQKHRIGAVLVLVVIGLAFLPVPVPCAVVFDKDGNFLSGALGNVYVEIGEAASSVGSDGVQGIVVGFHRADKAVLQKLGNDHHAIHVIDPVVAGGTHIDDRPFGKGALHFVKDEQ